MTLVLTKYKAFLALQFHEKGLRFSPHLFFAKLLDLSYGAHDAAHDPAPGGALVPCGLLQSTFKRVCCLLVYCAGAPSSQWRGLEVPLCELRRPFFAPRVGFTLFVDPVLSLVPPLRAGRI